MSSAWPWHMAEHLASSRQNLMLYWGLLWYHATFPYEAMTLVLWRTKNVITLFLGRTRIFRPSHSQSYFKDAHLLCCIKSVPISRHSAQQIRLEIPSHAIKPNLRYNFIINPTCLWGVYIRTKSCAHLGAMMPGSPNLFKLTIVEELNE